MAACCRGVYGRASWFSSNFCHYSRDSNGLKGAFLVCNISTSQLCLKKTPHTVGVPAWAKAAGRRKKVLAKMEKPKSEKQIHAEFNLANDPTEHSLYTTTRRGPLPGYNEDDSQIEKCKIALSADKTMFVCYHPAKPFPLQFSKDSVSLTSEKQPRFQGLPPGDGKKRNPRDHDEVALGVWSGNSLAPEVDKRQWWQQDGDHVNRYRDNLTDEEIKEVVELRKADPKLWTVNALSHMLKVKPLAVMLAAPLSDEQKFELEVEQKLLDEWTDIKRKTYRANQELERLRYYQETRGISTSSKSRDENKARKPQNAPRARNSLHVNST